MDCSFIKELTKLRKLSIESVENSDNFGAFQEYMHVQRDVELDLIELLNKVKNLNKCLILLCGSAGDGKSHLLAYLKNHGLLDDYDIYNDATESISPEMTAMQTLNKKLESFNDLNLYGNDSIKVIIAINLGTLNNFIESEYGGNFNYLKEYINTHNIFSSGQEEEDDNNSLFHYLSFSDYQVFSLLENDIDCTFVDSLFDRVFFKTMDNPFYKKFHENHNCNLCDVCPVRHNYQFMQNKTNRDNVRNRIIEVIVKNKVIVSAREILNFIFDILVHPELGVISSGDLANYLNNEEKYFGKYLSWTTPMLLDEFSDVSNFLNVVRKHDPLLNRLSETDAETIRFNSADNIWPMYTFAVEKQSYDRLTTVHKDIIKDGSVPIKSELKNKMYKFIVRLNHLTSSMYKDNDLDEYLRYLYSYYTGNDDEIYMLYENCQNAVMKWNGDFGRKLCCIDDSNEDFYVLENLVINPYPLQPCENVPQKFNKFSPVIKLTFFTKNNEDQKVSINVDYELYSLFKSIADGYRPTVQDKNQHADFAGFIIKLQNLGDLSEEIIIKPKFGNDADTLKFYKLISNKFKVEKA